MIEPKYKCNLEVPVLSLPALKIFERGASNCTTTQQFQTYSQNRSNKRLFGVKTQKGSKRDKKQEVAHISGRASLAVVFKRELTG